MSEKWKLGCGKCFYFCGNYCMNFEQPVSLFAEPCENFENKETENEMAGEMEEQHAE